jgi:hypothetical protein
MPEQKEPSRQEKMKRTIVKTVGWSLFFLGIGVFLLARPVRKGDYATTLVEAAQEYQASHPDAASDKTFQRIVGCTERLAQQSRHMDGNYAGLRRLCASVSVAAGLLIIHAGSWIAKPPE